MYLGGITNERSEGETEKVYKMYTFDQFYAVHSELGFNSVNSKQTNKQTKISTKYRGEAYGAYDGRVRGRVFSTDKRVVSISSFYH